MMDDMKPYAVHDENNVKGFFGEYRWMSNFFICPVQYEGVEYQSAENAYQSSKIKPEFRVDFIDVQPYVAKTMWKKYPRVDASKDEWDARKFNVMAQIVFYKFTRNMDLRVKLLKTNDRYLEETNSWGDFYWGHDINQKRGENQLGIILMSTRSYWGTVYRGRVKTETRILSNVVQKTAS